MSRRVLAALLVAILALQPALLYAAEASANAKTERGDDPAAGAGVTVTVLSHLLQDGRLDFGATWKLFKDPKTWTGALGGAVGYAAAAYVASFFLPPGCGAFLTALPRFFGAAIGFEFGRWRIREIDPFALAFQVLASTAGYALVSWLAGAAAPAWLLMAGATVFGVVANILIRKKIIPLPSETGDATSQASTSSASPPQASPATAGSLIAADDEARRAYDALVEAVRAGRPDVGEAIARYEAAEKTLRDAITHAGP